MALYIYYFVLMCR